MAPRNLPWKRTPATPDASQNRKTPAKRNVETIDLTGDDDDHSKRQRVLPTPSSSQNIASSSQPTPRRGQWRRPSAPGGSLSRTPTSSAPSRTPARGPSSTQRSPSARAFTRTPSLTQRSSYEDGGYSQAERNLWLVPDASQSQADEQDIYETIASTQNFVLGSEDWVKYGELPGKIVGVQYYKGFATFGEHVETLREPGNPYDSNAIRVDNMVGEQIGHIPKTTASKLAKYIDNRWLAIEAVIAGNVGQYDCPIIVNLFGPPIDKPESIMIRDKMRADKMPLQHINKLAADEKRRLTEERKLAAKRAKEIDRENKHGFTASQTVGDGLTQQEQTMDDIITGSERFNPRDVGRAAEQFGNNEDVLSAMPMAKQPEDIATRMLPYQLQALAWLIDRENPVLPAAGSKDFVQLWRRHEHRSDAFTNIASNFSSKNPKLASGGILADDMGLGKTLEMLSLIASDRKAKQQGESHATLIVAPVSVMSNWSDQAARHVTKVNPLRIYTYHGTGRKSSMKPADFGKYDVVITTYQTLANDYMPGKGSKDKAADVPRPTGLYSVNWRRIILDEGHTIRNPASKGAAAATAVLARSRWVLTGTPIVNSLKDLYSLVRFVGATGGLEKFEVFNTVLIRPLKGGDGSATALLQAIMSALCLRRKKEMKFIDLKLPALNEMLHRIDFSPQEKSRYDALYKQAKGTLQKYQNAEGRKAADAYSHLLEILLRLRQVCNHWQLCAERVNKLMETLQTQKTVDLTPENRRALQDMLQLSIESHEECAVCLEPLHTPVITHCGHSFGRPCIARVIETQHKCPYCRSELKSEDDLVEPVHEYGDEGRDAELDLNSSSTKLEALVGILKASRKSKNKTVVFSQWTRFLDIVQARLDKEGFKYCRIDGTMSAVTRDNALHALEDDPDCTVMLASLGVCAVGLNLVAANQVIMSDSWWAPAIEDQAVDRVHRLGQRKEVQVFRLVVNDSIEDRTLDIQAEKRKLMMMAFQEKSSKRGNSKNARLGDIQKLLK